MGQEDKGFVNIWDFKPSDYSADGGQVEEVVTEVTSEEGAEKIVTDGRRYLGDAVAPVVS